MSALNVRLADDKHQCQRLLASSRGTTINRLINEMTSLMLAEYDAEMRFLTRAQAGAGNVAQGLDLLKKALG